LPPGSEQNPRTGKKKGKTKTSQRFKKGKTQPTEQNQQKGKNNWGLKISSSFPRSKIEVKKKTHTKTKKGPHKERTKGPRPKKEPGKSRGVLGGGFQLSRSKKVPPPPTPSPSEQNNPPKGKLKDPRIWKERKKKKTPKKTQKKGWVTPGGKKTKGGKKGKTGSRNVTTPPGVGGIGPPEGPEEESEKFGKNCFVKKNWGRERWGVPRKNP